jgi:uncharacterized protein (TIGR00106 family)
MAIVAISIAPTGAGTSVGEHVARALRVLERQDQVRFEVGPMFTTLEGDLRTIFALVLEMQDAVFAGGVGRLSTVMKIDDRRDRAVRMEEKVERVRRLLEQDESGSD